MYFFVLDIELSEKNIKKQMGVFFMVFYMDFHFVHQNTYKHIKQTTRNTSYPHGIAWSSGTLDYDKFFVVFYDIKQMIAELFATRLEMCKLLNRFLEKYVEFWTTMAAQKFMILLEKEKRTVRRSDPVTISDTKKASMCRAKNKSLC